MRTDELFRRYNIHQNYWFAFEDFIRSQSQYTYTSPAFGSWGKVRDEDAPYLVQEFFQYLAHENERKRLEEEAEAERQRLKSSMLITSGFNFDGYTITRYSGYISGDDATQVGRGTDIFGFGTTNVGSALMDSLVKIRRNALEELKEAAADLGCNAVIGVDFDYLILDPETAKLGGGTTYLPYVFGVTANGNAVVIEKNATRMY